MNGKDFKIPSEFIVNEVEIPLLLFGIFVFQKYDLIIFQNGCQ